LIKDGLNVRDLELAELETLGTSYGVTQVLEERVLKGDKKSPILSRW
jgi:hypothetical protein